MQADRKTIGARLRARREYLNLTQQEVADRLSMNRVTYAQYEQGRNEMAVSDLPRIAEVLSVRPSYFFEDDVDLGDLPAALEHVVGLHARVINALPPGKDRDKYIANLLLQAEMNWSLLEHQEDASDG